jgi:hypothetical protein
MKRDHDIIRRILFNVQEDKYPYGGAVHLDGVSDEVCGHHVALIIDVGLAEGRLIETDAQGIVAGVIYRLTPAGHDFCDAIRDEAIWNKAKQDLGSGSSYGLAVLINRVNINVRQNYFQVPPND